MFRKRIKAIVELYPSEEPTRPYQPARFVINFKEPIRDVINVSIKQICIPPFPESVSLSSILVKSDLSNLTRCMNVVSTTASTRADLFIAVACKKIYPAGGFYYKSDYMDLRAQNRAEINECWFEFWETSDIPLRIVDFPQTDDWKITIELEFGLLNEQYSADRL